MDRQTVNADTGRAVAAPDGFENYTIVVTFDRFMRLVAGVTVEVNVTTVSSTLGVTGAWQLG
ncbi:hypothetical protein U6G28_00675 [Actinomycetaceae bacterium MB13-C1-2]|nr:hypothetical protein U6G28_00675 [Actinomycetaceae bacterium MB13-C1-2]